MNRDTLKQIMIDQKDIYLNNPLITRQYFLEANVNYCFVGIRRTGKSYMMYQQIKQLEADGIPLSQIIYVNFEDERLLEMTAEDLNLILEIGLEISKTDIKPYLFLDEIQNINGWEKFVRRIADMKYRINITGSNSKMLSSEIASTLGGRFVIMNIYPYSFSEYLIANNMTKNYLDVISTKDRADVQNQYNKYVTYGAFPELVEIRNKRAFLKKHRNCMNCECRKPCDHTLADDNKKRPFSAKLPLDRCNRSHTGSIQQAKYEKRRSSCRRDRSKKRFRSAEQHRQRRDNTFFCHKSGYKRRRYTPVPKPKRCENR